MVYNWFILGSTGFGLSRPSSGYISKKYKKKII
jgi:hypothetical protein